MQAVNRVTLTAGRFGLIALGILGGLALWEVAVRALGVGEPRLYTFDHHLGWRLLPGASGWQRREGAAFVRVNSEGFRGPERPRAKAADVFRVALLGDSFTEAQQVGENATFAAVAERELSDCPALSGRRVEVLNFGCDGYGTAQELVMLRRVALGFAPDAVVAVVFTGNDLRNNSPVLEQEKCRPFFACVNGRLVPTGAFSTSGLFRMQCRAKFALRHLQVLKLLGEGRRAARQGLKRWFSARPSAKAREPGTGEWIYRPPEDPVRRQAWRITECELAEMNRETRASGALFLAVTASNGIQVYPDAAARRGFAASLGVQDLFYPERRIAALGERDGFAVLNLAPQLQRYADARHLFLHGFANTAQGVGHWNIAGHRVAGRLIASRLCAMVEARSSAK